ncbi:MAG: hypothetical protein H6747_05580 [Deltaproteobacteria bacterium]|nr:hypothetical protein [Deltaproteobacteria bacterium]
MRRNPRISGLLVALLTVLWAVGCSDALVDGDWPGEALLTLEGAVQQKPEKAGEDASTPSGTLRMALLWSQIGGSSGPQQPLATAAAQTLSTAVFPARYRLDLYAPPAADALGDASVHGQVAVGTVVVYVDADGDGAFDAAVDSLIGGGVGRLLLYSPAGAEDVHFGAVPAGYSRMRVAGMTKTGGAAPTCEPGGPPPAVEVDPDAELPVVIDAQMPDGVLLDLNCDGNPREWGGKACPPPETLSQSCAGGDGPVWPCKVCKPPSGGPPAP